MTATRNYLDGIDLLPDEKAIGVVAERESYSSALMKSLYMWVVLRQEQMGLLPDIVTVDSPKFPVAKYRTFQRSREKLLDTDFSGVRGILLSRNRSDWSDSDQENYALKWYINRNCWPSSDRTAWLIDLTSGTLSTEEATRHLTDYARKAVKNYGYIFTAPRKVVASSYAFAFGIPERCCTTAEEAAALGGIGRYDELINAGAGYFLRDIHQVMFLSQPYLDLPVEGTTLEKWVAKEDVRGTLRKLNDRITIWTPPPEEIGRIREQLFLSGNLFYHRFFQTEEPDNPWARDFSKPFKPKDVPEIFRADYRRVIDPLRGAS